MLAVSPVAVWLIPEEVQFGDKTLFFFLSEKEQEMPKKSARQNKVKAQVLLKVALLIFVSFRLFVSLLEFRSMY